MSKSEKSIFARFDERKQAVKTETLESEHEKIDQQQETSTNVINALTDADMPDIDTLDEESDYSVFMSNKVSEVLKKQALRKLFLSPSINVLDSLNDYDEDYTTFERLGALIPHDLRQQIERKSREAAKETLEEKQKAQKEDKQTIESATNETQTTDNENDNKDKSSSKTTSN